MSLAKPAMHWPPLRRDLPISDGLKRFWPLWERAGGGIADIASGQDGAIAAGAPDWRQGLYLNGTGPYIATGFLPGEPTAFTMMARVKVLAFPGGSSKHYFWDTTYSTSGTGCRVDSSGVVLASAYRRVQQVQITSSVAALTLGEWVTLAVVMTPTTLMLYRDGVLNASDSSGAAGALWPNVYPMNIGAEYNATDLLNCEMDYAAYWNRALSDEDVMAMYQDPYALITPRNKAALLHAGISVGPSGLTSPIISTLGIHGTVFGGQIIGAA